MYAVSNCIKQENKCLEIMHKINKRRIASICIKNVMCKMLCDLQEASHEFEIRLNSLNDLYGLIR